MLAKFKKPSDLKFVGVNCMAAAQTCDELKRKDFKAPPNHLQCVIDGFALFSWVYLNFGDELQETMKEHYDAVFFFGNKVLKLDKELDSAWFESYRQLIKAHFDFIASRCEDVNLWTGKEDGAEAWFTA
jgi:hypothetical protein